MSDRPANPVTVYVVMDECWNPCFCSGVPESCHEHINEALNEGIEEAAQWVVREYVPAKPAEYYRNIMEARLD